MNWFEIARMAFTGRPGKRWAACASCGLEAVRYGWADQVGEAYQIMCAGCGTDGYHIWDAGGNVMMELSELRVAIHENWRILQVEWEAPFPPWFDENWPGIDFRLLNVTHYCWDVNSDDRPEVHPCLCRHWGDHHIKDWNRAPA